MDSGDGRDSRPVYTPVSVHCRGYCKAFYPVWSGEEPMPDIEPDAELDCVGLFCPMPISKTKIEIEKLETGQVLMVEANDPAAEPDIRAWAKRMGHEVLGIPWQQRPAAHGHLQNPAPAAHRGIQSGARYNPSPAVQD